MQFVSLKSRVAAQLRSLIGWHHQRERQVNGGCILLYHGVVERITDPHLQEYCIDRKSLQTHLRFLRHNLCPVSLSELLDAIKNDEVDRRMVVVSFDDALASQFTLGAHLLDSDQIPWTVAVPAGLVGSDRTIWTNEVSLLVLYLEAGRIPDPATPGGWLPTAIDAERRQSLTKVKAFLNHTASWQTCQSYIKTLGQLQSDDWLSTKIEECGFQMATWEQIKSAGSSLQVISHGMHHTSQNENLSSAEFESEYSQSRKLIQEQTGLLPDGFALPNGIHTQASRDWLHRSGYSFCLTSNAGRVTEHDSVSSLPRISAEFPLPILRNLMTGV